MRRVPSALGADAPLFKRFAPFRTHFNRRWGRAIIYVDEPSSVDAVYNVGIANGLVAEVRPAAPAR